MQEMTYVQYKGNTKNSWKTESVGKFILVEKNWKPCSFSMTYFTWTFWICLLKTKLMALRFMFEFFRLKKYKYLLLAEFSWLLCYDRMSWNAIIDWVLSLHGEWCSWKREAEMETNRGKGRILTQAFKSYSVVQKTLPHFCQITN